MVYSGELEDCKDICRSKMRLIDREVCEDRKNLHSVCQWVELSVLHLATSICRTNRTGLRFRERNKKARRVILGQQPWKEWCFVVLFQGTHMYTPTVHSPQCGSSLLLLCLLSAAEPCRAGTALAFPQVFSEPVLECTSLILHQ